MAEMNIETDKRVFLKKELDRHRICTADMISSIFIFILKNFKHNSVWQFSYFIQLLADANGVLVFLKFLTERFNLIEKNVH